MPTAMGHSLLLEKQAQIITNNIKMSWPPRIVSKKCLQDTYNIVPKGEDPSLHSDGDNSCSAFLLQLHTDFALQHFADFISLVKYTINQPGGLFK